MMMIPFLPAQSSNLVNQSLSDVYAQFGAIAFLLLLGVIFTWRVWRNSENAKIERQKADTERNKEDTRRDSVINNYASKYGELSQTVALQGVSLAKAEGKVDLLTTQLENERDKRLKTEENLKTAIRDLSDKLKKYEDEIAELKASINGKIKEIEALKLERNNLNEQLSERDSQIERLEHQFKSLQKSHDELGQKAREQAEQIASLAAELARLDPPKTTVNTVESSLILKEVVSEKKEGE